MDGEWKEVYFDIETTGLNPFESQIVTAQVRSGGTNQIWPVWESSEAKVIERFFEYTDSVFRRNTRFIGFNVLKFDVPFLTIRMKELGLLTPLRWSRLVQELNWFDLYQFLGDDFGRFREWKVGLTGKAVEITNDQIPQLFLRGKYDKILEYVNDEMQGYEHVYEAIKREKFYAELMSLRRRLLI